MASDPSADRQRLIELLRERAYRRAPEGEWFTLASGKKSPYFVNGKEITLRGDGLALVGRMLLDRVRAAGAEAVGGMSIGADPMIGAVVAFSGVEGTPLQGFIVRKAAKDHGLGDRIAGPSLEGVSRVALIEDVTTTGGSTLDAIGAVREAWPHVEIVMVLSVVDRQEGAQKAFAEAGYPFQSLLSIADLDS